MYDWDTTVKHSKSVKPISTYGNRTLTLRVEVSPYCMVKTHSFHVGNGKLISILEKSTSLGCLRLEGSMKHTPPLDQLLRSKHQTWSFPMHTKIARDTAPAMQNGISLTKLIMSKRGKPLPVLFTKY